MLAEVVKCVKALFGSNELRVVAHSVLRSLPHDLFGQITQDSEANRRSKTAARKHPKTDGYFSRDGALGSGERSPTIRMATPVTRPTISASAG